MIRMFSIFFLILGLVPPLSAQQAYQRLEPTAKELDASMRTDWYGVYFQDKKIGYFKSSRERTDAGIRESIFMNMKLVSFGQKAEMTIAQTLLFDAKAPYELIRAEFKETAGPAVNEFVMTRSGMGTFDVVHTVDKVVRKKTVKGIDMTLADSLTPELWLQRGPVQGSAISVRELEVKEQKIDAQNSKVVGSKTSLVGGVEVKFYEIETVSNHDQITVLSRHDDQGKMISGKIAGVFELRFEPEADAKNTEFSKDLFVLGMAKVDRKLGDLKRIDELVLDVDGPAGAFGDGPRQTLTKADGKSLLRLGKRFGKEAKAGPDDAAENLKETSAYDLSSPKVKDLAARAVAGATTDEAKVKNIAKFVHDFIEPNLSNTMPTIHDLIDRKKGDCKSYALLFTTLARTSGVPAREVSGLLYAGDDIKAFGGHAWNEVILNGVWIPIDASLNETEVNATHLSFGTDKTAAKNLLETIGKLKVRVVEVKTK